MTKFVADLHLHSAYARATSKDLNFDTISAWAKWKGIQLLSSADFTHPVWFKETKEKLKKSKYEGFYSYRPRQGEGQAGQGSFFVLGAEISCIYSQGGKLRRLHCLLYFPSLESVEKFNEKLGKTAKLASDGRPIIGMNAKNLLELALDTDKRAIFIPAHAWTPWFSLYGSNSGFDSIDEAFGDLAKYVYAIETGLSSDPAMNWRIKELDNRSIVSFSDAHSAPKMGREATVFDTDFSYQGLLDGLKKQKIATTVEFFPEEGKYHFTGHRNCSVRHSPDESAKNGIICPVCKKKLTVGVMHRVNQLAEKDRAEDYKDESRPGFKSLVPLLEIISEAVGASTYSEKVNREYTNLIKEFGSEFNILLKATAAEIEKTASSRIAEGVEKVRNGDIVIEPGFDGLYGVVKIWNEPSRAERKSNTLERQPDGQPSLFDLE